MENYWGKERKRVSRFSIETFWSHRTETIRRGIFLRFTIFLVSEKNIDKRGSRYHDFPSKLFSLIVPNQLVDEPSVFQELSGIRKCWGKREGGCHDFPSKLFGLTEPKQFEEEFFCVSLYFWYREKLLIKEVAGITIFRENCFLSECRIFS